MLVIRSDNLTVIQRNITEGKRQDCRKQTGMNIPGCRESPREDHMKNPHQEIDQEDWERHRNGSENLNRQEISIEYTQKNSGFISW